MSDFTTYVVQAQNGEYLQDDFGWSPQFSHAWHFSHAISAKMCMQTANQEFDRLCGQVNSLNAAVLEVRSEVKPYNCTLESEKDCA